MIKLKAILLLVAFYSLIGVSCRAPKDIVYRDFKNVSVDNLGFSSATLKVDVICYNPNNFGLQLNRTDLDIFIDSTYLGHSSQDVQVRIPRLQEFIIPIIINLDMQSLLKNGLTALVNKEVQVRVTGKVKVGKASVYKSFPVDYTTRQRLSFFK